MGIWCVLWGFYFAEGFGFVWDNYTWVTYEFTNENSRSASSTLTSQWSCSPTTCGALLGMSHLTYPLHRAELGTASKST